MRPDWAKGIAKVVSVKYQGALSELLSPILLGNFQMIFFLVEYQVTQTGPRPKITKRVKKGPQRTLRKCPNNTENTIFGLCGVFFGDRDRGVKTYRTLEGRGTRRESCPWKAWTFRAPN